MSSRRVVVLVVALLLSSSTAMAQEENADALLPAPEIPATAASAIGFVPAQWTVLQKAEGDLDGDGRADVVLILENAEQPEALSGFDHGDEAGRKFWPRMLVVALADVKLPGYRRLFANPNFITVDQYGRFDDVLEGDPLSIAAGVLSISFHQFASMGSWSMGTTEFKFRYHAGAMTMIGMERYTIHRASLDYSQTSINFLTHRASATVGNDDEDAHIKEKITRHRFDDVAPNLATLGDGLDYWPEGLAKLQ